MSPEQIQGGRGDSRTDVYALGMILYEIIAHQLPYDGDNALAVMNQHVTLKAPALHFYREGVPAQLEETVMKAIRRTPADRWQSMEELIAALKNPDSVDVEQLKVDREQERGDNKGLAKFGQKANITVTNGNLIIFLIIIVLFLLLIIAAQVITHHNR